ncbi:FAD-dependent monooxygenase [Lentzea sp. NPDC051213]|uniref:FAD-dependent monooxygenase n=1 Tax=Lentzea sp. NPDC051213 TaxID=3364126 RepID=UPI0037A94292
MTDVLIVGGGGAGLTVSALLSQLGVDTLLVNARPDTSALPKAHYLNQRTMEIFRDLGVADAVYERGTPPHQMSHSAWYAGLRGDDPDFGREFGKIECWGAGGRNPAWAAASACLPSNLPQIRLEPLLRQRAEELAPGRVRFNHDVTAISQDSDGVTATILDKDTGAEYQVRSRYLLGCDGGRTVGPSIGVAMEGHRDVARVVTVHFSADLSGWARDPEVLIRWLCLPQLGVGGVLAPAGPERWGPDSEEWIFHLNYLADDDRALDDAAVESDMRKALGIDAYEIHMITRWTLEGVVADRFRDGRVFLLGDAAHRHPPTGGLGLNSAVQDAHNLAWKLAAVLNGQSGEELLDTYEPERKPTTARNVQRSVENAVNHLVTTHSLGISPEQTAEENWQALRQVWDERSEDARRAVAGQSMEFDEHNIEYGYTYESSAVIGDGTEAPHNPDPIRLYQPGTRPGHPLPHAWLDDGVPLMDLVRPGRFLLIAGEQGHDWLTAAAKAAANLNVPVDAVRIGHADGDHLDPRSAWVRHRGITDRGAVLVRPDRFVAWRSTGATADPGAELHQVLSTLLGR